MTIAPVDTSSFTTDQLKAFNTANALGTGVETTTAGASTTPPAPVTPPASPTPPAPTGGAQTGADPTKAGTPGYDVYGNKVANSNVPGASDYTAPTNPNTPSTTDTNTNFKTTDTSTAATEADPAVAAARANEAAVAAFNLSQANIQNGVTPLSAGEQAQIDGLKQQFQTLIDQQKLTNIGATGSATTNSFATGAYSPLFQANTINQISAAGASKISGLQVQEASAVAALTQSLKDGDIKKAADAFKLTQDAKTATTKAIQDHVTAVQKAIKDAQDAKIAADKVQYDEVTKPIQDVASEAAKFNAPANVIAKINSSQTVADAITAAQGYLQDPTSTGGQYAAYQADALSKGLTPMTPSDFLLKQKVAEAYATEQAKNKSDASYTASDKVQQSLEQQGRQIIAKEFSARTGALGIENAKVNQANHLNSLVTQYYDPKTGNYNIPKAQYGELVLGMANLVSPTGVASDSLREEINQATAKGDINAAIGYVTGSPQTGNTQAVIKNFIDTIDRQAATAVSNRQAALDDMKALLPTDLEQSRKDALVQGTNMVPYAGQDRVSKSNVDNFLKTHGNETVQTADGTHSWWYIVPQLYEVPGATDQDVESYLKANGALQ